MNAGGGENGAGAPDGAFVRAAAAAMVGTTTMESYTDVSAEVSDVRGAAAADTDPRGGIDSVPIEAHPIVLPNDLIDRRLLVTCGAFLPPWSFENRHAVGQR